MSTRGLTQPEWSPCRLVYIIALIYVPCDEVEWKFLPICSLFTSAAAAKVVATQTTLERDVLKLKSCTAGFTCACREEDTVIKMRKALRTSQGPQANCQHSPSFWLYLCINCINDCRILWKIACLRIWTKSVVSHFLLLMTCQLSSVRWSRLPCDSYWRRPRILDTFC